MKRCFLCNEKLQEEKFGIVTYIFLSCAHCGIIQGGYSYYSKTIGKIRSTIKQIYYFLGKDSISLKDIQKIKEKIKLINLKIDSI